ncbi:DUF2148 domain-containing protein [Alistipes sp. OttesenSCG-928-B03]|nr:DUF2148 domain-containing protein [Alistipes sp. OttesenSCG-928-B03]
MVENEKDTRHEQVMAVARAMMAAARTAPKGRGIDNLEIVTVSGDDLARLAEDMRAYGERADHQFFIRDAANVETAEAVVLIGTRLAVFNLNCGYCGFETCAEKLEAQDIPCAFNLNDLGIALGSAASIAADNRIDNRVMYSVGHSALALGLLPECRAAFGIVLNCTSKSPFFDRPTHN